MTNSSPARIAAETLTSTPTPNISAAPAQGERLVCTFANAADVAATIGAILKWTGEFHKHYGASDCEQWLAANPPPAIAPEAWGMDDNPALRELILGLNEVGLVDGIAADENQLSLTADAIWKYCRTDQKPVDMYDQVWRSNNRANSGNKPTRQGLLDLLESHKVLVRGVTTPACPDRAKAGAIEDLAHKEFHASGLGPNRSTIYGRIKGKERLLKSCIEWLAHPDVARLVEVNGRLEPAGGDREDL